MSYTIRIIIALGIVFYYAYITRCVKKKKLSFRLALIWYVCGIVFLLLDAFPSVIFKFAKIIGIEIPLNGLLVLAIGTIWIINIVISGHISRMTDNIKELSQQVALLEGRVRELEKNK